MDPFGPGHGKQALRRHFGLAPESAFPPQLLLRFARRLGLDDAQVKRIRKDMFATRRKVLDQQSRVRLGRLEVEQLSSSAKPNLKAISRHIDTIAKAMAEIAKLRLGLWQRTRESLTAEQRAAAQQLRQQWFRRGRGRGQGNPRSW